MMKQKKLILIVSYAIFIGLYSVSNLSIAHSAWFNPCNLPEWALPVIFGAIAGGIAVIVIIWYFQRRQALRHAREQVQTATA